MQEQADTIRELKHQLQEMQYALAHSTQHQVELHSILQAAIATPGPNSTPGPKETPGPHRLRVRILRLVYSVSYNFKLTVLERTTTLHQQDTNQH